MWDEEITSLSTYIQFVNGYSDDLQYDRKTNWTLLSMTNS